MELAEEIITEIGTYPDDWTIDRVDSVFDLIQGKQVSERNRAGDNQRPFLRTRNVFWDRLDLAELDKMHFTASEEARYALLPGDLLLCEGGDVGRTAMWRGEVERCYIQNHLHRLRALDGMVDGQYGVYWFWYAFQIGNLYIGRGNKTTIPNMSRSKLAELQIALPPFKEQQRIAQVLSTVQQAIEQQERLIRTTTELKQALMQELFTEGLRGEAQKETEIGLVPESWEVVKLGEAVSIKNGQVDPRVQPYIDMPHVGSENIESGTGRLVNVQSNGELGVSSGNYHFTNKDVLYSKIRPYLNKVALPNYEGTCSADMYPLRSEIMLREFLYYQLLTERFVKAAISFQDRTGIPKINRAQLSTIDLVVPTEDEQAQIATTLRACDDKMDGALRKRNTLQDLFRTLLHELMTGKVRVCGAKLEKVG